ncbi:unnamed protein product [Bemisia tabaci]|uniref:Amino acid transporter n=2 Tax=Bemisia tabaci TaxID=7038 RepID=A0A9P0F7N5_BEMTA|nr:unnamed protein product [Bemisia tabaci]
MRQNKKRESQSQKNLKKLKENGFLLCTVAGVIIGGLAGYSLRPYKLSPGEIGIISYPGEIYFRALKLMMLPFVAVCITTGTATLNVKKNGIIAVRAAIYFLTTTFITTAFGILLSVWIHPGSPGAVRNILRNDSRPALSTLDNLFNIGRNIISDNILSSSFESTVSKYVPKTNGTYEKVIGSRPGTNMLGIVTFFILFGSVLGGLGKKAKAAVDFFTILYEALLKILMGVVWFTPVAVGSIICAKIYSVPDIGQTFSQLAWFMATALIGLATHQFVFLQLLYLIFLRSNPFSYYVQLMPCILTAFATSSKTASMPISFDILERKLQKNKRIVRFVLPLGSLNLNGTGLFMVTALIFIAQMNNVPLGLSDYITLEIIVSIMTMSMATIPSASLVTIVMLCGTIGVPSDDVSLLFTIDWFMDRCRTTNNIVGDSYAVAILERLSEKELNRLEAVPDVEEAILPHSKSNSNEETAESKVEHV